MQKQIDTEPIEPDIVSMAALYQQYAPAIFTYLLRHISSEEDAEDILVEVFLAALESERFSLLPEKAQLAWLWRVARNKMIDAYRRSQRRRSVTLESIAENIMDDAELDPEVFALQQEEYSDLLRHLRRTGADEPFEVAQRDPLSGGRILMRAAQ